jgi:copper amine oxidase-like protein
LPSFRFARFGAIAGASAFAASLALAAPAFALSVTVNGNPVNFAPAPIERAGRVFVPLRGVFERLGASVVYENGTINATGNGRQISLRIGSTQATVNGQQQYIDVAPFIIGASTYVPLRFVSQALGASVNWDGANQIVAIFTNGGGAGAPPPPPPPAASGITLQNVRPGRSASVASTRPTISADFSANVDPNSVRVTVDGLDVTNSSTRSPSGFIYAPQSPLQSMQHTVQVTGRDQNGASFSRSWTFTSGSAPRTNSLTLTSPPNGAMVGSTFTVSGRTLPGAHIHIVAGAVAQAGPFAFGAGNYAGDTTADGNGYFSQSVTLQTISGAQVGLTVTSTDPATNESAEVKRQLRVQ